ncbi:hypothetical protein [Massilia sp. NR 4-1]|uniref:pilus assembly PilX family protein n=1 Tax=Massilia sp. NR 4-1 TaxID=1678028 RepID=UPI00067C1711|nr:hypothetical protein [Massilia sp. NR 4-1]AKU21859.1 hypothetical protein ACZ75_10645 [Massilia sp. NR 4-1]
MRRRREAGATLLVVLLMLAGILLLGASGAQMALQDEMAARAGRDRLLAFQAAEDALMDAEKDIGGAPGVPPERSAHFSGDDGAFSADCGGTASAAGLCRGVEGEAPVWQSVDLAAAGVPFGRFTGTAMETGRGTLPFARPRYVIERLPYSLPGEGASTPPHHYYRVTAIGFGPRPSAEVVLQATLADKAEAPAGRLSWREISNWRELHEAAKRK